MANIVDFGLIGGTTALATEVVSNTQDPNTAIISLAVQIVGVISLLLKHRRERRARRRLEKPNYSIKD